MLRMNKNSQLDLSSTTFYYSHLFQILLVSGRDVDRPWRSHSTSGLKPELLLKPSIVRWFLWKVLPLKQMGALGVVVGCVHVLEFIELVFS